MMTAKEKLQRASASVAFDGIFKYIKKKPQENLLKLIDISQKFMGGAFPEKNFDAFRKAVKDESNVWNHFGGRSLAGRDQFVCRCNQIGRAHV